MAGYVVQSRLFDRGGRLKGTRHNSHPARAKERLSASTAPNVLLTIVKSKSATDFGVCDGAMHASFRNVDEYMDSSLSALMTRAFDHFASSIIEVFHFWIYSPAGITFHVCLKDHQGP